MPGSTRLPRDRMVYSAAQLVRAKGVSGTGVRDVVADAGAPRGSFQHYFPGGKDQLIGEALAWSGEFAARHVRAYPRTTDRPTPAGLFAHIVGQWRDELTERRYARGCPVMATAADLAGGDSELNRPLRAAANRWERAIVDELMRMNVPAARAESLATLMLSALEGAIMLARIRRDPAPLDTVLAELTPLLSAASR